MFRRVVSLVLLPCMLLTQSATFTHAHGGSPPAGHDLRPHVHTNTASASHHHGHHHHGPGSHHHHHDDGDDAPEPDTQPPRPEPFSDHDSDAVYLASVDILVNERVGVDEELMASVRLASGSPDSFVAYWVGPASGWGYWTHPPPPSASSRPIYVRLCALLI